MVTISQAVFEGSVFLKENGVDSPRLDAEIILGHTLGISRLKIITEGAAGMDEEMYARYMRLISLRGKGTPSAYLTGQKEFMGINFEVRPGVLIPRDDTEIIVQRVIEECRVYKDGIRIADVCCGSGAIGISIAKNVNNASVIMTDIASEALEVSSRNVMLNGVSDRVKVVGGDLLEPVKNELFDIIVSNPPYIPSGEINYLQREVRDYEPRIALDGGSDGLEFYRRLIPDTAQCIKPGGILALEIGFNQASDIENIMSSSRFISIEVLKDLSGLNRCIIGRYE